MLVFFLPETNKDPHFKIIYNTNLLNNVNNNKYDFSYILNNSKKSIYIKIPTFRIMATKNLLNFCKKIKYNKEITHIILDLRNNGDGNSLNTDEIFKKLYGLEMLNYIKYKWNKNIKKLWRNSKDVVKRLTSYNTKYHNNIIKNMKKSNKDIYIEIPNYKKIKKPINFLKNRFIYLLINKNCYSSCLICIDYFKLVKNNIFLVGINPMGYDTDYTEIIDFILPSKIGRIIIPTKKIIGKIRKSGERYYPDIKNLDYIKELMIQV